MAGVWSLIAIQVREMICYAEMYTVAHKYTHYTQSHTIAHKSTQILTKSRSHRVLLYTVTEAHNIYISFFEHWVDNSFVVHKSVSNTFFCGLFITIVDGEGGLGRPRKCKKKHSVLNVTSAKVSNVTRWAFCSHKMTITSRLLKRYADNLVTFDITPSQPLKVGEMWILSQD